MLAGGLPYDPEDRRFTGRPSVLGISPDYPVGFDIGRLARQQAADVVGGGLRGQAREEFLEKIRTDPKAAAQAKRIAEYHHPQPKPDRAIGIGDVLGVIEKVALPATGAVYGCITTGNHVSLMALSVGCPRLVLPAGASRVAWPAP